jgi:hypothetical protein
MLLETVDRHDSKKQIKKVCIESLEKQLPQIHSVPALVIPPAITLLFGKQVFDYLLLPGKGYLVVAQGGTGNTNKEDENGGTSEGTGGGEPVHNIQDPMAFSIGCSGFSDNFAPIEESANDAFGNQDRTYNWTHIGDFSENALTIGTDMNQEVRTKKELPDLSALQAQRALELTQNDLNSTDLPQAIAGRIGGKNEVP